MNGHRRRTAQLTFAGVALVAVGFGVVLASGGSAAPNSTSATQGGQISRPAAENGQSAVVEPAEHIFDDVKSCPLAA